MSLTSAHIQSGRYISKRTRIKVRPITGLDGSEGEWRYRSTLSLTSALDWDGWLSSPDRFPLPPPPKQTRYLLYRRVGGPHGRFGRVRKTSAPTGFDPQTVQSVARRSTD